MTIGARVKRVAVWFLSVADPHTPSLEAMPPYAAGGIEGEGVDGSTNFCGCRDERPTRHNVVFLFRESFLKARTCSVSSIPKAAA